jgi:hypothetical protein
LSAISEHLEKFIEQTDDKGVIRNVFVIYVGHGLVLANNVFGLALATTELKRRNTTALKVPDFAAELKEGARWARRFIILDCCYAGKALEGFLTDKGFFANSAEKAFSSSEKPVALKIPTRGTTLVCAADRFSTAGAPKNLKETLFTHTMLEVLRSGRPSGAPFMNFSELVSIVSTKLNRLPDASPPFIVSPDQTEGDLAQLALFPNPSAQDIQPSQPSQPSQTGKRKRSTRAKQAVIALVFAGAAVLGGYLYLSTRPPPSTGIPVDAAQKIGAYTVLLGPPGYEQKINFAGVRISTKCDIIAASPVPDIFQKERVFEARPPLPSSETEEVKVAFTGDTTKWAVFKSSAKTSCQAPVLSTDGSEVKNSDIVYAAYYERNVGVKFLNGTILKSGLDPIAKIPSLGAGHDDARLTVPGTPVYTKSGVLLGLIKEPAPGEENWSIWTLGMVQTMFNQSFWELYFADSLSWSGR